MQIIYTLAILLLLCLGCTNFKEESPGGGANTAEKKFEQTKWNARAGEDYPYRDQMLQDVVANVKLKGMKHGELISLLGEPDRVDNGHLFYLVSQKKIGFLTLHTKTLVIKLDSDSAVEWRKIHE